MSWRSVLISRPAKLSLRADQLIIRQNEEISVPLEDIAIIVIESREVTLTSPLLSACARFGVTLLTCDDHFLPCGQFLPFSQHSRFLKSINSQINMSHDMKSILWQRIIQRKIKNQAFVLHICGNDDLHKRLLSISESVLPDDEENCEAKAAALYFPALFGKRFSRRVENTVNIRLNYAYSIIRSAVARSIVMFGFLPVFGLWHKNELNAFNLADDLMEPFRQIAVLKIFTQNISNAQVDDFNTDEKSQLIQLLNHEIIFDSKKYSVLAAIERMMQSFSATLTNNNASFFKLPEMTFPKVVDYE